MTVDPLPVSFNEIETTSRKALIGSGVDPGTAADVAAAVRWLCEYGRDGVGTVVAAIQTGVDLAAVVRAVDTAIAEEGDVVAVQDNVLLFAGLCGPAAEVFGVRFELTAADWSAAIGPSGVEGRIGGGAASVRMTAAASETVLSGARVTQIAVSQANWNVLVALAARIYVPSSAHSRASGAGAGLSDND
ncbi:MAG: DUF3726 domain-containing protein [Acidimicrobiales bacterium]|nr:DUF3726 domain-containing protein [Acidimicrobiales bacterium]